MSEGDRSFVCGVADNLERRSIELASHRYRPTTNVMIILVSILVLVVKLEGHEDLQTVRKQTSASACTGVRDLFCSIV